MTNHDGIQTSEGIEGLSNYQFDQLDPLEQARMLEALRQQIEEQRASAPDPESAEAMRQHLERVNAAREVAMARARGLEVEAVEHGTVTYGRGTIRPIAAPLGLFGMRTLEFAGDKIVKGPQRVLSGLFKRIEQKGVDMIKKNGAWIESIPWVGPWLLTKAEKSLAEREEEEKKKRKKDDEKKKKEKSADEKLEKELQAAGVKDPKKALKAIKKHRKDSAEKKEDDEKTDDGGGEDKKDDGGDDSGDENE